jgi:RNA recognition motif-containing protein
MANKKKSLFVSGLRNNVNENDIRKHFTGCKKVTIKQCRGTSHLKYGIYILITSHLSWYLSYRYAFVCHRTFQDAKRNFRRPIDYDLLGSECHIEYVQSSSATTSNYCDFDRKKLMVSRIPENVSGNDLHRLFVNAHILRYRPARNIQLPSVASEPKKKKNKILLG